MLKIKSNGLKKSLSDHPIQSRQNAQKSDHIVSDHLKSRLCGKR